MVMPKAIVMPAEEAIVVGLVTELDGVETQLEVQIAVQMLVPPGDLKPVAHIVQLPPEKPKFKAHSVQSAAAAEVHRTQPVLQVVQEVAVPPEEN